MKKLLSIFSLLLLFINVKALDFSTITSSSGTTFRTYPSSPTSIGLDFSIATTSANYNTSFKIQLIYAPPGGAEVVIKETPFETFIARQPNGGFWQSRISGTLDAGLLYGKIMIKLIKSDLSGPLASYGTTSFNLVGPPIDPVETPLTVVEGSFVRDINDNKVYIGMNGKYRHIEDANTLFGVFKRNVNIVTQDYRFLNRHASGAPIGPNTRLVEDTNTGMAYYQENGVLRYINSPDAANKYSFDLKKAQKIQGTAGYTFGQTFY